jgi:hypothetical protein
MQVTRPALVYLTHHIHLRALTKTYISTPIEFWSCPRLWCNMSAALEPVLPDEAETPADLAFPVTVFDIAFHPTSDVLAAGLISGKLEL